MKVFNIIQILIRSTKYIYDLKESNYTKQESTQPHLIKA